MNVRKRGLALLMCICMIFTLLPFSVFAEDPVDDGSHTHSEANGVVMDKRVEKTGEDTYKVTLEQYVTGTVTPGTVTPIDVVLVLDVSGSMDENFGSGYTKKIDSLKSAVNSFIDTIAKDSKDSKIAIVKFAGDKSVDVGNATYKEDGYTYNYTQIVKGLTSVKDGVKDLKSAVNSLNPAGSTRADYGMEKAKEAFGTETANSSRQRVVIMFTDGVPTSWKYFESNVANGAILNANDLKGNSYKAKVYTIGIFSGAEVGDSLPDYDLYGVTNRYMHLVSSNYPTATSMTETGTDGAVTNGYYKVASDADTLSNAFTQIGDAVGNPAITLDSSAVLTDNVAPNFKAPANTTDVKVYTAA